MFLSFISYCINIRLKKKSNSNAIFLPIKLKKLSPVREVGGRKPLSYIIGGDSRRGMGWALLAFITTKIKYCFPQICSF